MSTAEPDRDVIIRIPRRRGVTLAAAGERLGPLMEEFYRRLRATGRKTSSP